MQHISSCTEATPNEVQIAGPQTDHLEPLHKAQDLALGFILTLTLIEWSYLLTAPPPQPSVDHESLQHNSSTLRHPKRNGPIAELLKPPFHQAPGLEDLAHGA